MSGVNVDMTAVNASLNSSQKFQKDLMIAQTNHSKVMAGLNAMKQAADKIRA